MAGKDTLVLVSRSQALPHAGGKEWMNKPVFKTDRRWSRLALNELQVCAVGSGRQE